MHFLKFWVISTEQVSVNIVKICWAYSMHLPNLGTSYIRCSSTFLQQVVRGDSAHVYILNKQYSGYSLPRHAPHHGT